MSDPAPYNVISITVLRKPLDAWDADRRPTQEEIADLTDVFTGEGLYLVDKPDGSMLVYRMGEGVLTVYGPDTYITIKVERSEG